MNRNATRVLIALALTAMAAPSFGEGEPAAVPSNAATIREQLLEGLKLAGGAQAAVAEFYLEKGYFPADNLEAGVVAPYEVKARYVHSLTIVNGVISVEYGGESVPEIAGGTLELVPQGVKKGVSWSCVGTYIAPQFLPDVCKP